MKQTLSLKLGQQLTMTPQLQQAIRLLQLSALDLQAEIQETLETNPMLELTDDSADVDSLNEDLAVGIQWQDVYPTANMANFDGDYDPLANKSATQSLADHLLWQLNLTPMAATDRFIATAIIDAIDPNGILTTSTQDIFETVKASPELATVEIEHEDVLTILGQVQDFDPLGVGARDLQECLLLQIFHLPADTPHIHNAITLLEEHLDLLGSKDFTTLRRRTKLSEELLAPAMLLIQTLNPRPGSAIAEEPADYIVPDVVVRREEGKWLVELNNDATPQIRINTLYEGMAKEARSSDDRAYLKENLQAARWFLKSLQTRHDTLLRVAARIVEVQRGFFEDGPEAMKPLILADIAQAVELHESTISRVTSRKYMATPKGVFELKYFFSSHIRTASGGVVSSTAIRALIQKLTADENPRKPLSDNKIAAILEAQNINVARRTVAKYRESLSIPPSNERKQLV